MQYQFQKGGGGEGLTPSSVGAEILGHDAGFQQARFSKRHRAAYPLLPVPEMDRRLSAAETLPSICAAGELAAKLGVSISRLDSIADLKGLALRGRPSKQSHYHYRVLTKPGGSMRLIESPKARLKSAQSVVLRQILDLVPPHEAAHGFRRGRSIVSFAEPHVGKAIVARVDLKDFFPTITRGRVAALFRTLGYPERVAALLAGVTTSVAPRSIWRESDWEVATREIVTAEALYSTPHLPQGARTSPAIANLCAYRLDCRLAVSQLPAEFIRVMLMTWHSRAMSDSRGPLSDLSCM